MDIPTYPPATAYEQPISVSLVELRANRVSLAELASAPAAWAVVVKHAPIFQRMIGAPQLKPYLSVMMVESFVTLGGVIDQKTVDAIDKDLQALPRHQWPAL